MSEDQKIILVTLAGGGFLWETQSLIKGMGDSYEYHYVAANDLVWKARKMGIPDMQIHPIGGGTTLSEKNRLRRLRDMLISFRDAYYIVRRVRPHAIICVGTSISVPLCFWGKFFKIKTIFVESMTRVKKLSLTGRIIGALGLSDRFYVQWPETASLQKQAIYKGTVL